MHTSPLPHTRHMPRPSHSSRFYNVNAVVKFLAIRVTTTVAKVVMSLAIRLVTTVTKVVISLAIGLVTTVAKVVMSLEIGVVSIVAKMVVFLSIRLVTTVGKVVMSLAVRVGNIVAKISSLKDQIPYLLVHSIQLSGDVPGNQSGQYCGQVRLLHKQILQ